MIVVFMSFRARFIQSISSLLTCSSNYVSSISIRRSKVQDFLYKHYDPRLFIDMGPHVSNCLIILGMAYERYILVCFPSAAKTILSRKRRIILYAIILAIIAVCWTTLLTDFFEQLLLSSLFVYLSAQVLPNKTYHYVSW